jgi:hypothetical protein
MVSRGAAGREHSRPKGVRWRRFSRRDPRKPITATLKWRGGAEGWVLVSARGESNIYHGATSIAEVVMDINQSR